MVRDEHEGAGHSGATTGPAPDPRAFPVLTTELNAAPDLEPSPGPASGADQIDDGSFLVGHREVDAVLERLDELDGLETAEHPEVYEVAHRRLHETLVAAGRETPGADLG